MKAEQYEIGMVGLGVMGRNLLLNMADHGHSVAGYDKDAAKVAALRQEAENRDIRGAADIKEFIALLRQPRAVMMLVPGRPSRGFGHQRSARAPPTGRSHHRCRQLLLQRHGRARPQPGGEGHPIPRRRACRVEKKVRVTDRASCPAGRRRLTSASVRCWKLSRPG